MNKKNLLAILVGFVAAFLLGWLIYGALLKNYMAAGTMAGVNKPEEEMNFIFIIIGTLCWVVLLTLLLGKMGISNFKDGAMAALWIGFLIALSYDAYFWAATNLYNSLEVICVDVIVSAVSSAITGGVIGWMLGMGDKPAATT